MTKLNEKKIIKLFQKQLGNKKFVPEDVEFFKLGKTNCVINVDTLVESTDIPPRTKISDAVRKSVVACISDFAAKGVKPLYGVISITLPRKFSKSKIVEIGKSIAKASNEFNFKILGGDTNEGKELVIEVFLLGFADHIIRRKGAKIGDLVFVTGPFGYSAAGLKILLEKIKTDEKFERKAKSFSLRPDPRLKFGIEARNYFTASMDSSDGLSTTLNELSRQNQLRFVLTKIPCNNDLIKFSRSHKLNFKNLVFNGGEEFEIVFTTSPKNRSKLTRIASKQKIPLLEIGYVTKGKGVVYLKNGKTSKIEDAGWQHLKG